MLKERLNIHTVENDKEKMKYLLKLENEPIIKYLPKLENLGLL